jgi:alpha-1,2-mannosyltransferase
MHVDLSSAPIVRRVKPWLSWPVALCVLVAAGLLVLAYLPLPLGHFGLIRPVDLQVFRAAGVSAMHGYGLYDEAFLDRANFHLGFTYPPFAALVMIPLAVAPIGIDLVLWTIATVLALFVLVRISFASAFDRVRSDGIRLVCLAAVTAVFMLTVPVGLHLGLGQIGAFLVLACVLDVAPRTTRWPRGVLVGLAAAIKLTPALFILHFVLTKQWRAAMTATLTMLTAWLVGALAFPADSWRYFFSGTGLHFQRLGAVLGTANQSLWGTFHRALGASGQTAWFVAVAAVALIGLVRAGTAHRHGQGLAAVTLVGLTSVLITPVSWLHHGVWLIPAIGLLVRDRRLLRSVVVAGAALAVMLLIDPYPPHPMPLALQPWYIRYLADEAMVLVYLTLLMLVPTRGPEAETAVASDNLSTGTPSIVATSV